MIVARGRGREEEWGAAPGRLFILSFFCCFLLFSLSAACCGPFFSVDEAAPSPRATSSRAASSSSPLSSSSSSESISSITADFFAAGERAEPEALEEACALAEARLE